jgi:hypothetical protein
MGHAAPASRDGAARPSESSLPATVTGFRDALAELRDADPDAHQRMVDELVYLANLLVAGDTSRAWSPAEAAQEVIARCDAGLRAVQVGQTRAAPDVPSRVCALHGAVGLFRVGWARGGG